MAELGSRPLTGDSTRRLRPGLGVLALAGIVLVVLGLVVDRSNLRLSGLEAVALGIIEGVTEFLPISSTGHLTVAQEIMGLNATAASKAAIDAYVVAIQGGAILAVLVIYRQRIVALIRSLGDGGSTLLRALVVGSVPAALVGLLAGDSIKDHLFGSWPVVLAWTVGGIWILLAGDRFGTAALERINWRHGLVVGLAQVVALWPGVSRSLVTIVVMGLLGYSLAAAVEFSFLLGVVVLTGATINELSSSGSLIKSQFGLATPVLGFVIAGVAAFLAVRWMLEYLQRHSFRIFGYYRLGAAVVVGVLILAGVVQAS